MAVDLHIGHIQIDDLLCADNDTTLLSLSGADDPQLIGFDDHMTLVAVGNMAHMYLRTLLHILTQSAGAGDLQIVRMTADC